MNKPITTTSSIRLPLDSWVKFREVLKARGRSWLMRWIDREHRKLTEKAGK